MVMLLLTLAAHNLQAQLHSVVMVNSILSYASFANLLTVTLRFCFAGLLRQAMRTSGC